MAAKDNGMEKRAGYSYGNIAVSYPKIFTHTVLLKTTNPTALMRPTCLTQVVPDVDKFPGHIACSAASRSEIVVPLVVNGRTGLVLDIDSVYLNSFDEIDRPGNTSWV